MAVMPLRSKLTGFCLRKTQVCYAFGPNVTRGRAFSSSVAAKAPTGAPHEARMAARTERRRHNIWWFCESFVWVLKVNQLQNLQRTTNRGSK